MSQRSSKSNKKVMLNFDEFLNDVTVDDGVVVGDY
jgi:hypothetical protein